MNISIHFYYFPTGKKKHKERKRQIIEERNNSQILKWTGIAVAVAAFATFVYILLTQ